MNRKQVIAAYRRHHNPTLARLFDVANLPIESRGNGMIVTCEEGEQLLDFSAGYGVFAVGHLHPRVQATAQRQLRTLPRLPVGVRHDAAEALAHLLRDMLPGDINHVLLAGSGSEAVDIALRVCQEARPERSKLVAARHSYHGKTLGALSILGQDWLRSGFEPLRPDVDFVPFGDITALREATDRTTAAVVLEPVLGGGYLAVPPDGYLEAAARICRDAGALLVVDEVQTGFGRTGSMFAVERENVIPDMIVLSKGMTGGHFPMAATAVADSLVTAMGATRWARIRELSSEASGSVLACAAAVSAIETIVELGLPERAAYYGDLLLEGLREVAACHPNWVLGVRGRGLMAGIEMRSGIAEYAVWLQMFKRGVLAGYSTNTHARRPVLRFFPPLIVERAEIDRALVALDQSLISLDRTPILLFDIANVFMPLQYHLPSVSLKVVTRTLLSRGSRATRMSSIRRG